MIEREKFLTVSSCYFIKEEATDPEFNITESWNLVIPIERI